MRNAPEEGGEAEAEGGNVWDCGSPLYDSHELASLGRLLDRNTMALSISPSSSNSDLRSARKAEAFGKQRPSAKSSGKSMRKKMKDRNEVAGMCRGGFGAFVRAVMKKH